MFENSMIPDTRNEVATPKVVREHKHINKFANKFCEVDYDARVLLLVGRDSGELMQTTQYGEHYPYVHQTPLGWAVVGSVCPNDLEQSGEETLVLRTSVDDPEHYCADLTFPEKKSFGFLPMEEGGERFQTHHDDEMEGYSQEDLKFLSIMAGGVHVNSKGNLEMPLPFKRPEPSMPSNQRAVFLQTKNTLNRLKQDPEKLDQCLKSMGKTIQANKVEQIVDGELEVKGGKGWWIPLFPVTHPKKGKVGIVFNSSAEYGSCLNRELLQGPDQNNGLVGVLTRFREGEIGFVADVESMFHSFFVNQEHRDYLRFYWFKDNDPVNPLVQYRVLVHIFGNRPSLAVATYGLRYATLRASPICQNSVPFLQRNFYVDDGLGMADTPCEAINILHDARNALFAFNIRLHKIVSSSSDVLAAFPQSELATNLKQVCFEEMPSQRTLGVAWDVTKDFFVIKTDLPSRPFTKRGTLTVINSIFNPLGIVSPIVLKGRLIQRALIGNKEHPNNLTRGWDDELPNQEKTHWKEWLASLQYVDKISMPRGLWPRGFGMITQRTLHVFCDASNDAIGYCIYLRSVSVSGEIHVSFLLGDSKVAPGCASSIPRLELGSALEASMVAKRMLEELNHLPDSTTYYSDSQVVLGYLKNSSRHFKRYVARRIQLILSVAPFDHWEYVHTNLNPADIATLTIGPEGLASTTEFLWTIDAKNLCQLRVDVPMESLPEEERFNTNACVFAVNAEQICGGWSGLLIRVGNWNRLVQITQKTINLAKPWLKRARTKLGQVTGIFDDLLTSIKK